MGSVMRLGLLAGMLGCNGSKGDDDEAPQPSVTDTTIPDTTGEASSLTVVSGPTLTSPNAAVVPLARELAVETSLPTQLTLFLDDGERELVVRFPEQATVHQVPVLGLPAGATVDVLAELVPKSGDALVVEVGTVQLPPAPDDAPRIDILTLDPDNMEPGYTFGSYGSLPDTAYLLAYDDRMELVWWWDGEGNWGDVRLTEEGLIFGALENEVSEWTFLGEETRRWSSDGLPGSIPVPYDDIHHEVLPDGLGGVWTLCYRAATAPEFPWSYEMPTSYGADAAIEDHGVAHIAPDGTVLSEWWMSEILDTRRISLDSLGVSDFGLDWVHLNGLFPMSDGMLVSSRHQDAVLKLSYEGELVWILGDPLGWQAPWSDALLTPVGELSWPYHQHAPDVDEDGILWLFDNHNHGRTPYSPPADAEPVISRVVGYRIDEEAGTVEQVASYPTTQTGPLFNPAMGDADPQPHTGNLLATYSVLSRELDGPNGAFGRGRTTTRLVEFPRDQPENPVFDVRLWLPQDTYAAGVKMYRAERVPSLYPPGVTVEVR